MQQRWRSAFSALRALSMGMSSALLILALRRSLKPLRRSLRSQTRLTSLERNERHLESLEGRIPWTTVGKVAIAVLPLFASLLLVGGLVWGVMSMFGIGPLFGWAWASFTAASLWWQKMLIAAATLGGASLFIWAVLRVSRWIYEELR